MNTCATCKWLACEFTSVCTNSDSDNCCEFMSAEDSCPEWEDKIVEGIEDESLFRN